MFKWISEWAPESPPQGAEKLPCQIIQLFIHLIHDPISEGSQHFNSHLGEQHDLFL